MWTREAIEARVEKLATEHEGQALVEAVREFSELLTEPEREVLGQVLLGRASYDYALMRQVTRRRWGFFTERPEEPNHVPRRRRPWR